MNNPFEIINARLANIEYLLLDIKQSEQYSHLSAHNKGETPNYLSVDEAAKFLNLKKQTIYQLVCQSKLKNFKQGKRLYFLSEDLQEFIQQGKRKTIAELAEESKEFLTTKKA